MATDNRKRIAVLGGGMGSLTTVYELTSQPDWNARYDITVYQLGWRLGGKGASGRNMKADVPGQEPNYKIEEHGLHIFFGFYQNAMRLMKDCYEELGDDGPFSSIEDAFKPHDFIVLQDYANGQWHPWLFNFPRNDLKPWDERTPASLWQHLVSVLKLAFRVWENSEVLGVKSSLAAVAEGDFQAAFRQIYRNLESMGLLASTLFVSTSTELVEVLLQRPQQWADRIEELIEQISRGARTTDFGTEGVYLALAEQLAEALSSNPRHHWRDNHSVLLRLLERFMEELQDNWQERLNDGNETLRRELMIINWALANARAALADGLLFASSLDEFDKYDYGEWIERHGAWEETLQSPLVRSLYDLVYGYPKGDITNPQLAAGVALRVMINIALRYQGAIMWKMQAGMGDVIFAPMYEVLKRRGVKFEFFKRITGLHLTNDQTQIAQVDFNHQVQLTGEYEPLVPVKGLQCWPSEPRYQFIQPEQVEELQRDNINLESFWTPWREREVPDSLTLRTPENPDGDFDLVLLGISLAALPYLCQDLLQADKTPAAQAASAKWRDMVEHVKTVPTQGGQLWLTPTLYQMGWDLPNAVVGTYVEPLDTYAEMSFLIQRENWPSANYPHNLAYFTGVIADPGMPPANDYDFPAQAQALVDEQTDLFLQNHIGYLWPKATPPENPNGLDPELLLSRYWRINIFPTERYVLSLPGTTQYRLKADESGFKNLYLTGDWLRNGFNAGAIEPTVISGMQSARAILDHEFHEAPVHRIEGEDSEWM